MTVKAQGSFGATAYGFEIAVSKSSGGQKPTFAPGLNQVSGVANPNQSINSSTVKVGPIPEEYASFASVVEVYWSLNSNPMVRVMFNPSDDKFVDFASFPGFIKNNIIGVRLSKPALDQASEWIYGVIQYAVPRFSGDGRVVLVDGHGLLFEAGRRTTSRAYKNTTAKNVISSIANKYGLTLEVVGTLNDIIISEADQNVDDFAYLDMMALFIDSVWYINNRTLVLQARQSLYSQTPKMTFLAGGTEQGFNFTSEFPLTDFSPELSEEAFKTGGDQITARGIDLDSKKAVQKVLRPKVARMGVMSLNSPSFQSDEGVAINDNKVTPAPVFKPYESGIFVPLRTRSNDAIRYQGMVEQRDVEIRATARVVGIPIISPGVMVSIQGVGEIFGGNYVVESVYHRLNLAEGFTTDLVLMRNAVGQAQQTNSGFQSNTKDTPDGATVGTVKQAVEVEE